MLQSVIQIGNSLGITFPVEYVKQAKLVAGKKVEVIHDPKTQVTIVNASGKTHATNTLTPEFKQWLDDISQKEADVIKALARV